MRRREHITIGGMTLIELMVVIMIIMVVAGIGFPLLGKGRKLAKMAQASRATVQLAAAVENYYLEYGKYPLQNGASDKHYNDSFTDLTNLFNTLYGYNTDDFHNPREVVFYEPRLDSLGKGNTLLDPWGTNYHVWADWDLSRTLSVDGHGTVEEGAVALSMGPDMQMSTSQQNKDDILSKR